MQAGGSKLTTTNVSNDSVYGDFLKDEISIPFPIQKFVRIRTDGVDEREIDHTIH